MFCSFPALICTLSDPDSSATVFMSFCNRYQSSVWCVALLSRAWVGEGFCVEECCDYTTAVLCVACLRCDIYTARRGRRSFAEADLVEEDVVLSNKDRTSGLQCCVFCRRQAGAVDGGAPPQESGGAARIVLVDGIDDSCFMVWQVVFKKFTAQDALSAHQEIVICQSHMCCIHVVRVCVCVTCVCCASHAVVAFQCLVRFRKWRPS